MAESPLNLVTATELPYLLSVPDNGSASAAGGSPVLCFLHGYDEGAPVEVHDALTRHGPLRRGSSAMAGNFIIVAPQLRTRGDVWSHYAAVVHDIIRQVQTLHDGNPEQTFLTGFSFGGNGVFDLALVQLDFWAALWAVDPSRAPPAAVEPPVWLSSGELSRRLKRTLIARLQLADGDDRAAGDRVYSDYGLDHVGTATRAYADDRIYHWLLAHHLRRV